MGEQSGMFYFATGDALVITDSLGTIFAPNLHLDRGMSEIGVGQMWEYNLELSWFGIGLPHSEKFKGYWYLPVGRYTALYRLHQTGVSGGKLNVQSSADTFWVVEPQGRDTEALNLLVQSYDLANQKKHEQSAQKLRELIQRYPDSPYVPLAMLTAAMTPEAYRDVIRKYPNSGEAIQATTSIAGYYINKKDKQGYIDAMKSLIAEFPNTEIAKAAERRLANMRDRFFEKRSKPEAENEEQGE
jgi:hypothetical protein